MIIQLLKEITVVGWITIIGFIITTIVVIKQEVRNFK